MILTLNQGDFFCVKNPNLLGGAIRSIEYLWSKDNEAIYSHSGIIISEHGDTLEALWTVKNGSLDAYKGEQIVIGRWNGMTSEKYEIGMKAVIDEIGHMYPAWRITFFMLPFLAKYISLGNFAVCSELTCKFLLTAGFTAIGTWKGQDPQDVSEMIHKWREMSILFEGVWEG